MAAPKPAPKGKGLTRKLGPLPVWAWLLVGALVGFFLLKKLGGQGAATATTQAGAPSTDQTGGTGLQGSAMGSGSASGSDISSALGMQQSAFDQQISGLTQELDALTQGQQSLASELAAASYAQPGAGFDSMATATQPGGSNAPVYHRISIGNRHFGQAAQAQTQNFRDAGRTPAFGGVISVLKLHNGAQITTYANGRKVEQMPGKTAYVIHR